MGYLLLAIALICGTAKGYCGKQTSACIVGYKDAVMSNLIRMVLCVVISLGVVVLGGDASHLLPPLPFWGIAALSGITTSVVVIAWLLVVRRSAYLMLDVSQILSVLVPTVLGQLFFHEQVRPIQWLGLGVLILSALIMCSYNNSIKARLTVSTFGLLALHCIAVGLMDFSQKLYVKLYPAVPVSVFNLYTYLFSTVTLILCYGLAKPQPADMPKADFHKIFWYIFAMSVLLFGNVTFKTLAAQHLDSVLIYPLNMGLSMILSAAMAALIFKEKLTRKCLIGLIVAFSGLMMINML